MDDHKQVDIGILGASRDFDTVHHEHLLGKLWPCTWHIPGPLNSWIWALLTGRIMRVVCEGESSNPTPVSVLLGAPQGMVWGPLVFLIYVNDIPSQKSLETVVRLPDLPWGSPIQIKLFSRAIYMYGQCVGGWDTYACSTSGLPREDKLCGVTLNCVTQAKYLGVIISIDL